MKVHFIYCGIILLILAGGFFGYNVISKKNQQDLIEKALAEEKVKHLEADGMSQKQHTDSVKIHAAILEGLLEYMKKNPKVIIEKYDKEKDLVFSLTNDSKVKFLASWLSKTDSH